MLRQARVCPISRFWYNQTIIIWNVRCAMIVKWSSVWSRMICILPCSIPFMKLTKMAVILCISHVLRSSILKKMKSFRNICGAAFFSG